MEEIYEFEALARRAVACKHWKWMPGMAVTRKDNDVIVDDRSKLSFKISEIRVTAAAFEVCEPQHRFVDVATLLNDKTRSVGSMFIKDLIPDLTDPATRGCLLELVRKAWKQPSISTRYSEYQDRVEWDVPTPVEQERMLDILFFTGKTEAEALVAALEAAP